MKKRIWLILLIIVMVLSMALPVFADSWKMYFPIIITNTGGTAGTNVPILMDVQGSSLASGNFINADGTDTRMKLHSAGDITDTDELYMMDTAKLPVVIPSLPASGQVQFDLYTGYSPVIGGGGGAPSSFPIISGISGNITWTSGIDLSLTNANSAIELYGYFDLSQTGDILYSHYTIGDDYLEIVKVSSTAIDVILHDAVPHTNTIHLTGISSGVHTLKVTGGNPLKAYWDTVQNGGNVTCTFGYVAAPNETMIDGTLMPYTTYFKYGVTDLSTLSIWFQPIVMVTSTTITNRAGAGTATIAFGTNPVTISISYGSPVSYNNTTYSGSSSAAQGYQLAPVPMPANWYGGSYSDGTVTVTNLSAAVLGSGTYFNSNMVGKRFRSADGVWYTVLSVTDTTHLILTATYGGGTLGGQIYLVTNLPNLPLYGVFEGVSSGSGIPINTLYFIIMVLSAFMLFFFAVLKTHSIMLSAGVLIVMLAMASGTGVIPGWIVYVMGIGSIGILFLARQIG